MILPNLKANLIIKVICFIWGLRWHISIYKMITHQRHSWRMIERGSNPNSTSKQSKLLVPWGEQPLSCNPALSMGTLLGGLQFLHQQWMAFRTYNLDKWCRPQTSCQDGGLELMTIVREISQLGVEFTVLSEVSRPDSVMVSEGVYIL